MLSIVIPSRSPQWLRQTVEDLLKHAEEEIEVIVVLDGIWPEPHEMPPEDDRVRILHHGLQHDNVGMRGSINAGMRIARGEFVMKIDEQCAVDQGFDVKLKRDCGEEWVVIPRRYRLLAESWTIQEDGRLPIDYMFLAYPYERPFDKTCGLHGDEWRDKARDRADIMIDDTMSWQGSCYFMRKSYWDKLFPDGLDDVNYGTFTQEAQEIGNTVWLSGGRLVVNKTTWYAHWHKGKHGKGYGFSNEQYQRHMEGTERGRLYCIDYWLTTKAFEHDFEWLLNKFAPVPTWPENWKQQIVLDAERDYSRRTQ